MILPILVVVALSWGQSDGERHHRTGAPPSFFGLSEDSGIVRCLHILITLMTAVKPHKFNRLEDGSFGLRETLRWEGNRHIP